MQFLADQDVYKMTLSFLANLGHEVIPAKKIGMHRASDRELLKKAKDTGRLLITRDKDYGALVFIERELSGGVILLRSEPATINEVHKTLRRVLQENTEKKLQQSFCVVKPYRYRIRVIGDEK